MRVQGTVQGPVLQLTPLSAATIFFLPGWPHAIQQLALFNFPEILKRASGMHYVCIGERLES